MRGFTVELLKYSKFHGKFMLSSPLTTMLSCTSGFADDVRFSYNGANGADSEMTLCFVEFAMWRHWGQCCCLQIHGWAWILI